MITKKIPETWQQLQNDVSQILKECGFDVEIEKKVQTVRGEVELDVYAEEIVKGRKYTIVCECKHWKARIPQSIVHSFRTVLNDLGANIGYIISLNGFQSGSIDASNFTNINLVTWKDFQTHFEKIWLENYFCPHLSNCLEPIIECTEPFVPSWFDTLSNNEKREYFKLQYEYIPFGLFVLNFTHYLRFFSKEPFPKLPVIGQKNIQPENKEGIPLSLLTETCYREFSELAIKFGEQGIKKFWKLRDRRRV